jgi:hypothetical protein
MAKAKGPSRDKDNRRRARRLTKEELRTILKLLTRNTIAFPPRAPKGSNLPPALKKDYRGTTLPTAKDIRAARVYNNKVFAQRAGPLARDIKNYIRRLIYGASNYIKNIVAPRLNRLYKIFINKKLPIARRAAALAGLSNLLRLTRRPGQRYLRIVYDFRLGKNNVRYLNNIFAQYRIF